ncbi:MAG: hypothetical protein HN742_32875 [Lentisphaerae bacterium]|jgi:alpha-2-macroglobulin|nr:hypothetical protein [Lentisphaerota bacterium]MBT5610897.1 hypothetical protein [Lentisphaerota bacterium]MBT7059509.1 hypothetical protein [Lentisphaerota bacterium]MBT7846711.1 hypothetical protein [Lentisphaerota bacterium]
MSRSRLFLPITVVSLGINVALFVSCVNRHREERASPGIKSVTYEPTAGGGGHFVIRFKTEMALDGDTEAGLMPVVFTPPIPYHAVWDDTETAVLFPNEVLPPGRQLAVRSHADLRDAAGRELAGEDSHVETDGLELLEVGTAARSDLIQTRLTLRFSGMVNPVELMESLTITDGDGHELKARPLRTQPMHRCMLVVTHAETCRKLTVTVAAGLRAHGADLGTDEVFTQDVKLSPVLEIGEVSAHNDYRGPYLRCRFAGDVVPESKEWIRVDPPVVFTVESSSWEDGCRLRGDFAPRTFYKVSFKKGLRTAEGLKLLRDVHCRVVTGDLRPVLAFASKGPYLPQCRRPELPVRVCNIARMHLDATRIYPNNLVAFFRDGPSSAHRTGRRVGSLDLVPKVDANSTESVSLPLDRLLPGKEPGIYTVSAMAKGRYWPRSVRTVVWTDLAMGAVLSDGEASVWVMSLEHNAPVDGCETKILSYRNQELGSGVTDAHGLVRIPLTALADEEPYLAVGRKGEDLVLLGLVSKYRHDMAVFDTGGRGFPEAPYEAFLYTERGICRPGEDIALSALVRGTDLNAAGGFPAELRITDPRGRLFRSEGVALNDAGFAAVTVSVPPHAPTGEYTAQLGLPGGAMGKGRRAWGNCSFMVGHYVPDRIRVQLEAPPESCGPGETFEAALLAEYYFGQPAAEHGVVFTTRCSHRSFTPQGFAEYTFGNRERKRWSSTVSKTELKTGSAGDAVCEIEAPELSGKELPVAALQLVTTATVREPGGRTVSASQYVDFHAYPYYVGLRSLWDASEPPESDPRFAWVAVDPAGNRISPAGPLNYTLFRDVWRSTVQLNNAGNYVRKWFQDRVRVSSGEIPVEGRNEGTFVLKCEEYSSYVLVVSAAGDDVSTLTEFWYWRGDAGGARPTHLAGLEISSDKRAYRPGDTAQLTLSVPSKGQALICTGSRGIEQTFRRALESGKNTVAVTIPESAYGSLHVAVTAVRDRAEGFVVPRRLFGMAHLTVKQDDQHRLQVELATVPKSREGELIPVTVSLSARGQPVGGYVQLLGVDEGLLALTAHQTPDPFGYFYGPRRCELTFGDVYDHLFPESPANLGSVSVDGGGDALPFLCPVKTEQEKPAVVLVPLVTVPPSGSTSVEVRMPSHTGALRLMAISFNADSVGHAEREVVVRDPISIQITAPRAVAPGDEFEVTAHLFNHDVEDDAFRVSVEASGPLEILQDKIKTITLARGGDAVLRMRCRALRDQAGPVRLSATLSGGDNSHCDEAMLAVRPPSPPTYRCGYGQVPPGTGRDLRVPGEWLTGTAKHGLRVSASIDTEATGALTWLRRYPYGCLEQTTSAAFPLLYWSHLFPGDEAGRHGGIDGSRVALERGIERLMLMELSSGGFSMWPGNRRLWASGSVYAAHFLVAARKEGISVDPAFWRRTVAYLRSAVLKRYNEHALVDRAYALYVLACAGAPESAVAGSIADDPDAGSFIRFLAAAALLRGGRAREGAAVLKAVMRDDCAAGELSWDMDSDVRRAGLALSVLLDVMPIDEQCLRLLERLRRKRNSEGHWGTTQDNAVVVIALAKWARRQGNQPPGEGQVTTPSGQVVRVTGETPFTATGSNAGKAYRLRALGPGALFYAWESSGVPLTVSSEPVARGLRIKRSYVGQDGESRTRFRQGELIRVKLELNTPRYCADTVVVDLLPGGLEIEDSSLVTRAGRRDKKKRLSTDFVDKRDDRLLLFCDLHGGGVASFSYSARAVTRGDFAIPCASVEAMYDPEIRASTGGGDILVVD